MLPGKGGGGSPKSQRGVIRVGPRGSGRSPWVKIFNFFPSPKKIILVSSIEKNIFLYPEKFFIFFPSPKKVIFVSKNFFSFQILEILTFVDYMKKFSTIIERFQSLLTQT
jgi:hypothetical protein